jgi:hypothetical protein
MARRLRCPCGKELQLPDAPAGKRFQCPACKRALSAPGTTPAAAAEQSVSTSRPTAAGQSASGSRPKTVAAAPARRPAAAAPAAARRPEAPPRHSRWPWVVAIAAGLLAGGGSAAWMYLKRKPAETEPVVQNNPGDKKTDDARKDHRKKEDPSTVKPDETPDTRVPTQPFTIALTFDRPDASPGTRPQMTVRAVRAADFQGEITLSVDDLPAGVTWATEKVPEKQTDAVVRLEIAPSAKPGTYPVRVTGKAKDGDRPVTAKATADLVLVAPFELKPEE